MRLGFYVAVPLLLFPLVARGDSVEITVEPTQVIMDDFQGVGYQFDPQYRFPMNTAEGRGSYGKAEIENIIEARWRRHNPAFCRIFLQVKWWNTAPRHCDWKTDEMVALIQHLELLRETRSTVYLTNWYYCGNPSWLGGGNIITDEAVMDDYAATCVAMLDYLVIDQGFTNIKYFCIANELQTLEGWGRFGYPDQLKHFQRQMEKIRLRLDKRGGALAKIQLVGNDAGHATWWTIKGHVAAYMDDVVGIYGGHHYVKGAAEDKDFFRTCLHDVAEQRRQMSTHWDVKGWLMGEYGPGDFTLSKDPRYALQLAEFTMAQLNQGVKLMSYWAFMNYPAIVDDSKAHWEWMCQNNQQWGCFAGGHEGFAIRPHYYSQGLITTHVRPDSRVVRSSSSDDHVFCSALYDNASGRYVILLTNRNDEPVPLQIVLQNHDLRATFDRFVFDSARVPTGEDLPSPEDRITMTEGAMQGGTIPPTSFAMFVQTEDGTPPPKPLASTEIVVQAEGTVWRDFSAVQSPRSTYYADNKAATGNRYIQTDATKVGDFVEMDIYVETDFTCNVILRGQKRPDRGQVKLLVNGQSLDGVWDQYGETNEWFRFEDHSFGRTRLQAGRNTFRLECVGKNRASRGYVISADQITLTNCEMAAP